MRRASEAAPHLGLLLTALITLAPHVAIADVKRHASVPEALQGRWAADLDRCGDDKSVIVLSGKAYAGPDAKCAVAWVSETAGPRGSIYSAHMQCPGTQSGKASTLNLIIRPDGQSQLSIGLDFNNLKPYRKCSAKEAD